MKHFLPLVLAICVCPASAADWVGVTIPHSEDNYFYDRSKLVINGAEVTYWKKIVFKQPQKVKDKLAASGLMRERIHCNEHTLRLLSFLYHDAAGAVIDYVTEPEKEGAPIIPDTVGDVFEQTLCKLTKPEDPPPQLLSPTMGMSRG